MIANISNGEKTASIHLPYSSIQLAGVLSYLGDEHIKGCDLLCNGEMKNNIFVSLEPTGIAERNIVEITRMQDISLAMLNSEIRLLESMPYEHKLGVMDKIASERPKSIYNVRQLINSYNEPSVDKSHIYAFFDSRNESEVIVDPKYLMDITKYEEPKSGFIQTL